ncbi:MAG: hypothetical protein R3B13_36665 [Polyangiaceae bacterium]
MDALSLSELLLALAVTQAHPGRSPYSLEVMPECGTNAKQPTCEIAPACPDKAPQCRPPRYSTAHGAWVRMERRETAERRFAGIAQVLGATAERLVKCEGTDAGCERLDWPGSPKSLALATLAVALHESGLREDVQFGRPPLGRGPQGEACLVQVALSQAPRFATWLPPAERERIAESPVRREKLAKSLLGDSPAALGRCFEVGMRMLARSRAACGKAGVPWDFGMFSMYGGGKSCNVPPIGRTRSKTFQRLTAARPVLPSELKDLLR